MPEYKSWQELKEAWDYRADAFEDHMGVATTRATRITWALGREILSGRVYGDPIPLITRGKNKGKKRWRRIGNLRRLEQMRIVNAYLGIIENIAVYALARHNLGLAPGDQLVLPPPPKYKRKTNRIAPWRAKAFLEKAAERLRIYHRELLKLYRRGRG